MKEGKHEGIGVQIAASAILAILSLFLPMKIGIAMIIFLISMGVWILIYNQMRIIERLNKK